MGPTSAAATLFTMEWSRRSFVALLLLTTVFCLLTILNLTTITDRTIDSIFQTASIQEPSTSLSRSDSWSDRLLFLDNEALEDGTFRVPPPAGFFNRTPETSLTEERKWWRGRMDHRETAFITSANNATFPFIENLVCSLMSVSPDLLERLVVWALDDEVANRLIDLQERILAGSFGGKNNGWRAPLGVYFDVGKTGTKELTSGKTNSGLYFGIVDLRREFYVHLLDAIGINFVFTDADAHFSADPLEDLNLPFGVPNVEERTGVSHKAPKNVSDFYTDFPDLIYSTDARKPYHHLKDPFEGQKRIPKLCGGFFFARSNPRTVNMYRRILRDRLNDQWGVDDLLNNHLPAVLVDPLPAGLTVRKGEMDVDSGDPIRVRVLSQTAYSNAMPQWIKPGTRGPDFEERVRELGERGEKEVLFHPNYWLDEEDPGNRIFIFTDNKTWIFDELGMWKVKDGRCDLPRL
ncbi:hypothetical protein HDU67_008407 [Dinochytrium kinnereticum]|nr:hypothetical protein HDU67_008407 [Dinochytrium kinnereticum]